MPKLGSVSFRFYELAGRDRKSSSLRAKLTSFGALRAISDGTAIGARTDIALPLHVA
jgi:hypothetical protein